MSLLSPQLQAFVAVCKHNTVHAAADALSLTQTAVTQRIRTLEKQLRTTLFIRSRRGMELTAEGEALLRYCTAARDLEGEALATIQGAAVATEIEVNLTAPSSLMYSRIIPECVPVMQQFANLVIHFISSDTEDRHQALRSGMCDFAIIYQEQLAQEMQSKVLKPEQYVLVAPSSWKQRKLIDIIQQERIIDFNESDQVTFNYLKKFQLFDTAIKNRIYANRTENLALLVSKGIGYTTLAKEFAQPYIDNGELITLNQRRTIEITPILVWYDRPEPPQYFQAIISSIQ